MPHFCSSIPTTHLNAKKAVFSQALRYNLLIADGNILQKELDSPTISPLDRKYPLEVITRNITKVLLHSRYTLLYRTSKTSSSRSVLPVMTQYSSERKQFTKSVRDHWHIIENDPQLHSIWPNPPVTSYHKTESLKDILVHSSQAKPTFLRSAPNKHRQ